MPAPAAKPALLYSTYVSRSPADAARSVAVGRDGSIYVVGHAAATAEGKGDAFVAHLSADGSTLLYLVYLGGGGETDARAIALDAAGNAYIAGETFAPDFPVRNALQASCSLNSARACSGDAFVTKLEPSGAVIFSTYLGGSGEDGANAIALDSAGNIYVGGATASTDFPVFRGVQGNLSGNSDGFIAQIAGDGSRVLYATYLGGAGADEVRGISVDAAGNLYVTGQTFSPDFPVANAIQANCRVDATRTCNGEAFITKLAAITGSGSAIVYSTYLGGSGGDAGNGIAVDALGSVYVTGTTSSVNFPMVQALEAVGHGKSKAFVTKLSADGAAIVYSTYLGGTGADEGNAIAVDAAGNAVVSGGTNSADFPLVNPVQAGCKKDSNGACYQNVFVAALNAAGSSLNFGSYFGGSANQAASGIALDSRGAVYFAGGTNAIDFPAAKPAQIAKSPAGNQPVSTLSAMSAVAGTRGGAFVSKISGVGANGAGIVGGDSGGPVPQAFTNCTGTATIWLGGTGNWSNAGNWSTGVVPNSTSTNVCIDNGNDLNSVVTLDTTVSIESLTVDSGDELIVGNNQSLSVAGNISNDGLILVGAAGNNTFLRISGAVTLSGAGLIKLATSGNGTAFINELTAGSVLTNAGSTIDGFGQIGNNGLMLVNQAGGTINADAEGQTLQLAGLGSVTNAGLLESNGGVLQLNASIYNNLGGTITSIGGGSTVQLVNSVVIQGGTLNGNGGLLGTGANNAATLDGATQGSITILGTYTLADNSTTIVSGTLVNSGTIQFGGAGNNTFLRMTGGVMLTGGGTVILNTTGNGSAIINQNASSSTLTNVNNSIQGRGQIGNNGLALVNQAGGTINANAAAPLVINASPVTNPGLLEATNGGTLQLSAANYINAGGTITANGNASTVQLLSGTVIQGGVLTTALGGVLGTAAGQTVTLDGSTLSGTVTNQGTYTGADNSTTIVAGTITNTGVILIGAQGNNTFLRTSGAVTLTGGGTLTLTTGGNGTAIINQNASNSPLTNVDNIIQGKGQIGNNGMGLVNQASGVINGNVPGALLLLNASGFTNQGLIEATLGGILQLSGTVFNNLGGNITANGAGSAVQIVNGATIQGGTITATGGGALGTAASQTITLDGVAQGPLTIAGIYTGSDNSATILAGSIVNTGVVQISAAGNNTFLRMLNGVTLSGAGVVALSTSGNGTAIINQVAANSTLTNADNSIRGAGQIGNNGLTLINKAAILANTSGQTLVLNPGPFTNQGLLQAAGGGTMVLTGTTINNQAGSIDVDGAASAMQFVNGVVIQGGTLTTTNAGVLGAAAGQTITLDGSTLGTLSIVGAYTGADNSSTIVSGTINNTGTIQISAAGNNTFLRMANGVTLQGAGAVKLTTSGNGTAIINEVIAGSTLTNADNVIQGRGQIGNNGLSVVNKATIVANISGQGLTLNPSALTNQGVLQATGGATLQLSNAAIVNQSGSISVDGAGSVMQFVNNATIQGGTMTTTNGGVLGAAAGQSITLDGSSLGPLRIVGTYTGPDNSATIVTGTINNTGSIQIAANGNNTFLRIANAVTLTGAGNVTLSTSGNGAAIINQLIASSTLTNVNNIIQGTGQIGNNGLTLVNQGSVEANQNGRAIVLNPNVLTNTGLLEAIGGGVLQLSNAAINNAGGSIKVDGGASAVQFVSNATIQGGTLATANGGALGAAAGQSITLDGSTHGAVTNLGTYTGADNSATLLIGSIINSGLIQIAAAGNNTFLRISGGVALTGAGNVTLSTSGNGTAIINQLIASSTLTNVDNVIQGTGQIGNNGLTLVNQGSVEANQTGKVMVLNPNSLTNAGLLEAIGGGVLQISNAAINNAGGSIKVDGGASAVQFVNNAMIQGGTLATANGGVLGAAAGQSITLDGSTNGPLTNLGAYTGADNSTTVLVGSIINSGLIQINAAGNNTFLRISNAVMVSGAGTVLLSTAGNGTAVINQLVANSVLTNMGNVIQGTGQIGNNGLTLVNAGTVNANLTGLALVVNPATVANAGLLEASGGGVLVLSNSSINNAGGSIVVDGAASLVQFVNAAIIQGGTIGTVNGGVLGVASGNSITLDGSTFGPLTNSGTYSGSNNSTTVLAGTIVNNGTIQVNATGNNTFLRVNGPVTLQGTGTVSLSSNSEATAIINEIVANSILTNAGNTIQGNGQIGSDGLALVNQGTITAELAGLTLALNPTVLTNQGLLEAAAGGVLQNSNTVIANAGGTIEVNGVSSSVQFVNNVVIQGGTLSTLNGGVLGSVSGENVTLDGTVNAVAIGVSSTYTVGDNSTTNILGTINNLGTILLNSTGNPTLLTVPVEESATLTGAGIVTMTASVNKITGPALDNSGNTIQDFGALNIDAFTQDSGATRIPVGGTSNATTFALNGGTVQVDGALNASSGVTVASAGTLSGTGTISGNVTANGTVEPGDLLNPGILTIAGNGAGNYTQGATGTFGTSIGGTTAGTQFTQMNLTGAVNLSGTLNVILINGFAPVVGNQFAILTAGSITGQFTTTIFPALPSGLSWKVTNNPASVVLSITSNAATLVSIAVTPANPSVAAGNTQQFTATGTFSDNSTEDLTSTATWASSDTTIATVSATGLATTKMAGSATISATQSGVTGQTTLTASAAVLVSIAVTPANPSVAAGNTQQFTATGTYSDSSKQDLTATAAWASSDTTIATVSATGLAATKKAGSATISATQSGVTGQTTLTATAAVLVSVAVTPVNPTVAAGSAQQFTATGTFSDGSAQNLTNTAAWASSDTTIATITNAGLATGVKAGSATISATQGGVAGQTTLTVTVPNFLLTVALAGTGTGSVKSDKGGIDCPATSCSGNFAQGTQVVLTATAASGSSFTSFAGGGCAAASPCTVTVNSATTVTATFDSAGTPTFTPLPGTGLTATGNPGDTFEFPLQLTGPPGQTITLSCTPDPTAMTITCAVAPATVTLNSLGTTSTFIQVSSFCSWGAPRFGPRNPMPGNWLLALGALALLGCAFAARKRGLAFALPIASLALLLVSVVGCSNGPVGPAGRTPPGTYHLTITAKAQSGATGQVVLTLVIK